MVPLKSAHSEDRPTRSWRIRSEGSESKCAPKINAIDLKLELCDLNQSLSILCNRFVHVSHKIRPPSRTRRADDNTARQRSRKRSDKKEHLVHWRLIGFLDLSACKGTLVDLVLTQRPFLRSCVQCYNSGGTASLHTVI